MSTMKTILTLVVLLIAVAACSAPSVDFSQSALETLLPGHTSTPFFPEFEEEPTATSLPEPTAQPQKEKTCSAPNESQGFPRFARLMHDSQWMPWPSRIANPDWPRGFSLEWYPETVPLWVNPKSGDGSVTYTIEWLEYLRDIQPNDDAAVWIARIAAGLFNKGNPDIPILDLSKLDELPRAEGISSGGNVVLILETRNGSARIKMIDIKENVPDPENFNYSNVPWLITKFTSVSAEGANGNAGGIDVYFPNLANNDCGYWVEMDRVELFPKLPFDAVAQRDIAFFNEASPSSGGSGSLGAGGTIKILEYLPQGSDVWGRTDRGWFLLEYQIQGQPVYTTSWSMQTNPPMDIR